jgi:hypothetical protein
MTHDDERRPSSVSLQIQNEDARSSDSIEIHIRAKFSNASDWSNARDQLVKRE